MKWIVIYMALLVIGILSALSSVMLADVSSTVFLTAGLVLAAGSLLEIILLKLFSKIQQSQPLQKPLELKPVESKKPEDIIQQKNDSIKPQDLQVSKEITGIKQEKKSVLQMLEDLIKFRKKEPEKKEEIKKETPEKAIDFAKSPGITQAVKPKKSMWSLFKPKKKEEEPILKDEKKANKEEILKLYIQDALKRKFPKDKIKEAALASGWPADLFEKVFDESTEKARKLKKILILSLVLTLLILVYVLYKLGFVLFSYWLKALSQSSPLLLIGIMIVMAAVILFFIIKIKGIIKEKRVEYHIKEEKNVEDIKKTIEEKYTGFETDLDKLFAILKERGKVTAGEVAKSFNVTKEQAEEWGKILKEQDLIMMHYPAVGEPELIWRQLKSTE